MWDKLAELGEVKIISMETHSEEVPLMNFTTVCDYFFKFQSNKNHNKIFIAAAEV